MIGGSSLILWEPEKAQTDIRKVMGMCFCLKGFLLQKEGLIRKENTLLIVCLISFESFHGSNQFPQFPHFLRYSILIHFLSCFFLNTNSIPKERINPFKLSVNQTSFQISLFHFLLCFALISEVICSVSFILNRNFTKKNHKSF